MRLCVVFTKEAPLRFVSHLDIQRLFQRAFRRARLPLAFSQGFNPHPLVSFAAALSVGMTSSGEYLDVTLTEDMTPEAFTAAVAPTLPAGARIVEVFDMGESRKSLTSAMERAEYSAHVTFGDAVTEDELRNAASELLSGAIVIQKKTKGGIKPTDIRPWVGRLELMSLSGSEAVFEIE